MKPISMIRTFALLATAYAGTALAALGDDTTSLATSPATPASTAQATGQVNAQASVKVVAAEGYEVHESRTPHGTVVRQYAATGGKVFGVAWSGPVKPDLQAVLGSYFPKYVAMHEDAARTGVARNIRSLQSGDLIVEFGGHMRAYSGRAYVPTLMPASVDAAKIQ